jgi:peroxiredoxin
MKTNRLLASFASATLVLGLAGIASAQPSLPTKPATPTTTDTPAKHTEKAVEKVKEKAKEKVSDEMKKSAQVGDTAPDFKLKDTEGKEHTLASLTKDGNIVVLQWFNPDCPFVKMHYDNNANTFGALVTKYKDKKVVLLAINSGAEGQQGAGLERNAKARKDWKMEYSILLDESGDTGRAYGAKNTPAMVVIDKTGKIAYMGAIDDGDPSKGPGKTNYVVKAVDELLAGKPVTTSKTKPYGCSVKYKN